MHAKAERLEQELKKEREEQDAQEAKDAETIKTLHIEMTKICEDKDTMKKKLIASQNELKGTLTLLLLCLVRYMHNMHRRTLLVCATGSQQRISKIQDLLTDWRNLAYHREARITELTTGKEAMARELSVSTQKLKDADGQPINILEIQKKTVADLAEAQNDN